MAQVELIALKEGSPDGNRRFKKGARYAIGERAAELLVKLGWAKRVPPDPKEPGRYQRRDMRARD